MLYNIFFHKKSCSIKQFDVNLQHEKKLIQH